MFRIAFVTVIKFRLPLGYQTELLASAEPEKFRDELRTACQLGDTEREDTERGEPQHFGGSGTRSGKH